MIHNFKLKYNNLELVPLQAEHIENLRNWRNNKEQTKYLRQIPYITEEMQKSWYENYKTDANIISFAIMETQDFNRMIGSVSLYNFAEDCVEIGKIQIGDAKAQGKGFGKIAFTMLLKLAFELFKYKKVVATVNVDNVSARKSYFKIGFKIIGQHALGNMTEDDIEITKEILINNIDYYDKINIEI